jgi:phosphate propanoyltransferase/cyclic nucleotide-binding protein
MTTSAIPSFLKENVSIFHRFSAERLPALVAGSRLASFEANESVAHQGDEATHFGVVLSGAVNASALGDGGARQSLGQLKAGDTFGEMALMTGHPLPADFIAESRCEVLLIPVSLFQSVIVAEPGAVQHISRTIAERMKAIMADPAKAAAAVRRGDDPYGLKLKGERPEKILVINCGSSSLKYIQVEIAMTEQFKLGVHPPIRESGDIAETPGCTLEGTTGSVKLERGVICALRHVHMTPEDALRYGVRDKSVVRVRITGDRELVFGDVLVRVDPNCALAMHIDTDEANAANVQTGAQGYIESIQSEA